MPEQATPTTTPAAPITGPTTPDPLLPVAPKPVSQENDADFGIQQMIAARAKKAAEPAVDPNAPKGDPKPAEPVKPEDKKLGTLISKTLGFRTKPVEKPAEPAKAQEPAKPAEPVKPAEPAAPAKTIVGKKKAPAQPQDPVAIATAAATAAVKAATQPVFKPEPAKAEPTETLKEVDLHELSVAKYLAETNPKYKGAERVVLEHLKKADAYASRWEQQNPGKVFNPEDDEHNDFYETLEKPWSDHEFRIAEQEMAAERVADRKVRASHSRITELEQEQAVVELRPVATQTFQTAAAALAKGVGEDVWKKISTESFDKFAESDPVSAGEIGIALDSIQPLIDTIIQLDEPRGRIKYNEKNKDHQAWAKLLIEKESQYIGSQDENGNTYISRSDWAQLKPAERYKKVYLTADHLVAEVVSDAIESTKDRIQKERERIKKVAKAMGYIEPGTSPVTKQPESRMEPTPQSPAKPVSPSDSGSPRMDTPDTGAKTPVQKALAAASSVLFGR